jgi:hypothetical protein
VSFAAITVCVSSQRVFIDVVYENLVMDSVRKLLDTPSYLSEMAMFCFKVLLQYFPGESEENQKNYL